MGDRYMCELISTKQPGMLEQTVNEAWSQLRLKAIFYDYNYNYFVLALLQFLLQSPLKITITITITISFKT